MEFDFFKNKLSTISYKINVHIDEDMCLKFFKYMELLNEWNNKINLTSIVEPEEIIIKHFIDSLTAVKYIGQNTSVVDIGTGAGFPGIPINIVLGNKVTLVDSLQKRINFLEFVKTEAGLSSIKTIHSRAEDFSQDKNHREQYDVAISRAVARLNTLVEYLIPSLKVKGKAICMKGPNIEDEIEEAGCAIKELGGKIVSIDKFKLPETEMERTIIIIEKIKKTPKKYPRKAGTPSKLPITCSTFNEKVNT